MKAEDSAWIEEAVRALEQETVSQAFLEEALIAQKGLTEMTEGHMIWLD